MGLNRPLAAGLADGFAFEGCSGLRTGPGCGQFVPKRIAARRKGPLSLVGIPSRREAVRALPLLPSTDPARERSR